MKAIFYLIACLPAVWGLVLIAAGVWVICRFKHSDTPDNEQNDEGA